MYILMENKQVICRPTAWFKLRAIGMAVLFLGMGLYFFYDAARGYPHKNEVYFTHKAFELAGQQVEQARTAEEWRQKAQTSVINFEGYPVPGEIDPDHTPWPEELSNYELMKSGWHDAWVSYTTRKQLPLKPVETPLDHGKITEQWIAGGVTCALFLLTGLVLLRTLGRVMAIDGDQVRAAGREFRIGDINRLDMRKWKTKGIAYAFIGDNRRIRLDGFCYGGFAKEPSGAHAEDFMRALLDRYDGEIIDYESAEKERAE